MPLPTAFELYGHKQEYSQRGNYTQAGCPCGWTTDWFPTQQEAERLSLAHMRQFKHVPPTTEERIATLEERVSTLLKRVEEHEECIRLLNESIKTMSSSIMIVGDSLKILGGLN